MVRFTAITRSGAERQVTAPQGISLMEAIRSAGIDELLAMCGGCLSCATCHVVIEAPDGELIAPRGPDEEELLQGSEFFEARSRLSCQVALDNGLEGARVRIAPED